MGEPERKPTNVKPISLSPLTTEEALRIAMRSKPPVSTPAPPKRAEPRKPKRRSKSA